MPTIKQSNQQIHLNDAAEMRDNERLSTNDENALLENKLEHLMQAASEKALVLSDRLQHDHDNLQLDLKNLPHLRSLSSDQKQELNHEIARLINAQSDEIKERSYAEIDILKTLVDRNNLVDLESNQQLENIQNSIDNISRESDSNLREFNKSAMYTLADSNLEESMRIEKLRDIANESEWNAQNIQKELLKLMADVNLLSQDSVERIRNSLGELGNRLDNEVITRLALVDEWTEKKLSSKTDSEMASIQRLDELRNNLIQELELTNQQKLDQTFEEWLATDRIRIDSNSSSKNLVRGNTGERLARDYLEAEGFEIAFYKPDIRETNQRGIDIIALKHDVADDKEYLYLIDNKALTRDGNVNSVSALTTHLAENIKEMRQFFEREMQTGILVSKEIAERVLRALDEDRIKLVVTNANVTTEDKILTGVTEKLGKAHIEFINVFERNNEKNKQDSKQLDYRQTISEERRKKLEEQDILINQQKIFEISREEIRKMTEKLAIQLDNERMRG